MDSRSGGLELPDRDLNFKERNTMNRYVYINVGLVCALVFGALLTGGLVNEALAQSSGASELNGTYVFQGGSPAPGFLDTSANLTSNYRCEPSGTYVSDHGGPSPANPCMRALSRHHCPLDHAACPVHSGPEACG